MPLTGLEELLEELPEDVEVWVVEPLEAAAFAAAFAAIVVKAVMELAMIYLPYQNSITRSVSVLLQLRCQFTPGSLRLTLALLSRLILRREIAVRVRAAVGVRAGAKFGMGAGDGNRNGRRRRRGRRHADFRFVSLLIQMMHQFRDGNAQL